MSLIPSCHAPLGITAGVNINIRISTQGEQCDALPHAHVRGEGGGKESRCFEQADNVPWRSGEALRCAAGAVT
jgi:hypothetical protein